MTDIFLYSGEANPADIRLRDPTTLAGAGEVNISGAILEGSDSAAGTLTLEINLSGAITEGSDVVAGAVGLALSLSGAITEGSDAVAGTLTLEINVSGAIQEGSDAVSGSLEVIGEPPVEEPPSFGANLRWNKRLAPRKKKKEKEREPELVFETQSIPMAVLPPVEAHFYSEDEELMQALTALMLDFDYDTEDEDELLLRTIIRTLQ
jgi:hypothetical protein